MKASYIRIIDTGESDIIQLTMELIDSPLRGVIRTLLKSINWVPQDSRLLSSVEIVADLPILRLDQIVQPMVRHREPFAAFSDETVVGVSSDVWSDRHVLPNATQVESIGIKTHDL